MPTRRDRTTGLELPSPVDPGQTICLRLVIPNAPQYRQALRGVLSELGKPWTWSMTSGEDNAPAYQAAELWREALASLDFQLDCGETMNCDDIVTCISASPAVKAAIQAVVPTAPIDGYTYPPGTPLTPSQMTARLNEIDDCGFDAFWAQTEQYVDYMIDLGQDVLDQIAVYSAALDAGENVPMGQFLGKLKNSSTAGKVVDFLQWALTVVKAAYEGADNAANRDAIKCAIFCANRDSCLITIQGTLDILNERLGGLLTPGDLNDLPSMVDAFVTAGFNPALALDLWILFLMGSAQTAGMFGLEGIDETLQMVLAVAVNDANNDWETKCEDCAPGCYEFSFTADNPDADSGFDVVMGQTYTVRASGTFVYDASTGQTATPAGLPPKPWGIGIDPNAGVVELIAKIGIAGAFFPVGEELTFVPSTSGRLRFTINEANPSTYFDNTGEIDVEICLGTGG